MFFQNAIAQKPNKPMEDIVLKYSLTGKVKTFVKSAETSAESSVLYKNNQELNITKIKSLKVGKKEITDADYLITGWDFRDYDALKQYKYLENDDCITVDNVFDTTVADNIEFTDVYEVINGYKCRKLILYTKTDKPKNEITTTYWIDESVNIHNHLSKNSGVTIGLIVKSVMKSKSMEFTHELQSMEKRNIDDTEMDVFPKNIPIKTFEELEKDMPSGAACPLFF